MKSRFLFYIPDDKAAQTVAMRHITGIPLFLRGILTAADCGETQFILVAPQHLRRLILRGWQRCVGNRPLRLHLIPYDGRATDDLIADIRTHAAPNLVVMHSNLLASRELMEGTLRSGLATDFSPVLYSVSAEALTTAHLDEITQGAVPASAGHTMKRHAFFVHSVDDIPLATRFLTENIRMGVLGMVARHLNKRISLPISLVLSRFRVSPNTITVFNMFVGLMAGVAAAGKTYWALLLGSFLFQMASVFDGCDGEVAKLTFRTSKFGQYIDSISDTFALVSFFGGLIIHNIRVEDPRAIPMGIAFFIGVGIMYAIMIRFLKRYTQSASLVTYDKEYLQKLPADTPKPVLFFIQYGKYGVKKDFFSLLIFVFGLFGILEYWLYFANVAVWSGSAVLTYLHYRTYRVTRKLAKRIVARSSSKGRLLV